MTSRREFLLGLGAAGVAGRFFRADTVMMVPHQVSIDRQIVGGLHDATANSIRLGYASITWDGNDAQAIDDISALGFRGIQLRSNILPEYRANPAALREKLAARKLTFVALSSGAINPGAQDPAAVIAEHVDHAKFVRDVGGLYLQVTDEKPRGRDTTQADYVQLGKMLNEIGKQCADIGIPLGYHNHMGSMGESPAQVEQILASTDERYVKFELDIAHYHQGGGDSAKAIRDHAARLLFLHIKDVEAPVPAADGKPARAYRFVELGRGRVALRAVFAALADVKFSGWCIVELDGVPGPRRTAREAAEISKAYLKEKLGLAVG